MEGRSALSRGNQLPRGLCLPQTDVGRKRARQDPQPNGPQLLSPNPSWGAEAPKPLLTPPARVEIRIHHAPACFLIRVRARRSSIGRVAARGARGGARKAAGSARAGRGRSGANFGGDGGRGKGRRLTAGGGAGAGDGVGGPGKRGERGRGLSERRKTTPREKLVFLHFTN